MLFDVGRASGTKLCRLLWNMNLVEIEMSYLCLPWSLYLSSSTSVSKDNTGAEECLCRDNLFFRAPEAVTTAKWRDFLEREQFSSQIVAISGDEAHCVSKR